MTSAPLLPWRPHAAAVLVVLAAALASWLPLATLNAGGQGPQSDLVPAASFTVVVDPGHGGDDHGAVGSSGVEEKALVLEVARRLQSLGAAYGGLRVRLTRDDDRNLTIDQRAAAANGGGGGLFVSLHANFSPSPRTAGVEVGTFRPALSPAAVPGPPARRDEGPVGSTAVARGPALVRWDQAQAQHVDRASTVAQRLVERFRAMGPVGPRAWYQAPLKPLASVNMPAVLVEIGYLSNSDEEAALGADDRQNGLAQAVLDVVSGVAAGGQPAGAR